MRFSSCYEVFVLLNEFVIRKGGNKRGLFRIVFVRRLFGVSSGYLLLTVITIIVIPKANLKFYLKFT